MAVVTSYNWAIVANQFRMNDSITDGNQSDPAVAANADGTRFFGVWSTPTGAPAIQGELEGRQAGSDGAPIGSEFPVNTTSTNVQSDASVASLLDGKFVVTFTDTSTFGSGNIRARLFNPDGSPLPGGDFIVSPTFSERESDVSGLPKVGDGGFVVTWMRELGNGDQDLYAAVYNANGTVRTAPFIVNNNINDTNQPSVAGLINGGFVVAWQETPAGSSETEVRFRLFDANGNSVDGTNSTGHLIDTFGSINKDIQVAGLPDGGFVVAYTDNGWNASSTDITVQVFNANGTARSIALQVNTLVTSGDQDHPQLAVLSNGYFAVKYQSSTNEYLQVYDASGTPVDDNEFVSSSVIDGKIAALQGGRLALVEQTSISDGSGNAISAAIRELVRTTTGDGAGNVITGDGLRDIITGGDGKDTLSGAGGDDVFIYSANSDIAGETVDGGNGTDTLRIVASGFYNFLSATLTSIESLEFNTQATGQFTGAQFGGITSVKGSLGNDAIRIVATTLDLSSVSFSSWTASDTVTIFGSSGVDNLTGSNQADTFIADGGADTLHGNGGDDTFDCVLGDVLAGALIDGGSGTDTLRLSTGGATGSFDFTGVTLTGVERLQFDTGHISATFNASQFGAGGISSVIGAPGTDSIVVNGQNVDLSGVAFQGWAESDKITINGTAGNDILHGSGLNEIINGGAGDDTAVYSLDAANYNAQHFGNLTIVVGPNGVDRLTSVEHLQFADGIITPEDGNPLFDTAYYLTHNPDVFHAGINPLQHFNQFGWHENRKPNAYFHVNGYLAANPDVAASGLNPLDHYHQIGWQHGRDPGPAFDTKLYLIHNPDVAAAHVDPFEHFLSNGFAERRQDYDAIGTAVKGFDAEWYLFHNPDVAAAHVDPLAHFNANGWHEGRNPNAYFDTAGYLAHYADVAASGMNPLTHYEQFGWQEGRDPSVGFDTLKYLAANPDVAAAHINPLDHFINNGIYEGRTAIYDGLFH